MKITVIGLFLAAVASSGCYRTVANIRVDESNRLVVDKVEGASDEETPLVEETDAGVQKVEIKDEGYLVRIEEYRLKPKAAREDDIHEIYWEAFRTPVTLKLDLNRNLEIENADGDKRRLTQYDLIEIKKYDAGQAMVIWGVGLTAVGCLYLIGGAVVAAEPDGMLSGPGFFAIYAVISVPFLSVGIPLLVAGARRQ